MGATNTTPNLNLPQFADGDKPTWRGDVNDAMIQIDAEIAARRDADETNAGDIDTEVLARVAAVTDLENRTVAKNRQQMWLEDAAGVAIDGVTECTSAIQAAINAAQAAGVTIVSKPGRVYVINDTLNIVGNVDFYDSTFSYSGVGIAFRVGDPVNGVTRAVQRIGRVVNTAQTSGWADVAGSIGVQLVDINKSQIHIKSVVRFEVGVDLLGHARGCAWNEIHFGELVSNKINLRTHSDQIAGYTNANIFIGGSFNHDVAISGGGTEYVAGTRHVQILADVGNVSDQCVFIGSHFEGNVCEYMVDSAGKMIAFNDCRWETNNAGPKVWFRAGSYGHIIRAGFKPESIIVTNDGDATNCIVWPATGDIARIYIPPNRMTAVAGAPALSAILRHPCWDVVFPGADILSFTEQIPLNWHTFDVLVHLTSKGGGNGNAKVGTRVLFEGTNATLTQPVGGVEGAFQNIPGPNVKYTFTGNTVPIANDVAGTNKTATFNIYGSGGTNTLGVSILGVTLVRRS
jgi:hypothetical protein